MNETRKKLTAFGNGLRLLRKSRKLNQAEFAALFDLTPSSISRFEGATAIPNFDTAIRLAAVFGLTPEGVIAFGGGGNLEGRPASPEVAAYLDKARRIIEGGGKEAETLKNMLDIMKE